MLSRTVSQRVHSRVHRSARCWRVGTIWACCSLLLTTGCLNSSYSVRREELLVQATLAPEARGRLQAVQRIGTDVDPGYVVGPPVFVWVGPSGRLRRGRPPRRRRRPTVEVVPGRVSERPAPRPPADRGPVDNLPSEISDEAFDVSGGDALSSGRSRSGSSGGGSSSSSDGDAEAILFVATAVILGFSLAATEGMRFEGDVLVSPDHPVHLAGPGGEAWVPLAELTPELALWADDAVLLEADGVIQRLSRAPLNRRGFVFAVDLGASAPNSFQTNLDTDFATRMSIGVFPVHGLGLLAGAGVGMGSSDSPEWRVFGELQLYPLQLPGIEFGLYGQFGRLYGNAPDGVSPFDRSVDTNFGAAGVLVQVDLTTRLALTLRGGALYADHPVEAFRPEALLGLAVY